MEAAPHLKGHKDPQGCSGEMGFLSLAWRGEIPFQLLQLIKLRSGPGSCSLEGRADGEGGGGSETG